MLVDKGSSTFEVQFLVLLVLLLPLLERCGAAQVDLMLLPLLLVVADWLMGVVPVPGLCLLAILVSTANCGHNFTCTVQLCAVVASSYCWWLHSCIPSLFPSCAVNVCWFQPAQVFPIATLA